MRGHDPMNEEEMIGIVGKLADAGEETYRRRSSPSFRKLLISMCFCTFSA
jgi:hypothetical protein